MISEQNLIDVAFVFFFIGALNALVDIVWTLQSIWQAEHMAQNDD